MCARFSALIPSSSHKPRTSQEVPTFTLNIARPCSSILSHALFHGPIPKTIPSNPQMFSRSPCHALNSQNNHHSDRRQGGFSSRLLLSQARCRRWMRLFGLPFQFSAFDCTTHTSRLISFLPVFCQPVPVCSTCR